MSTSSIQWRSPRHVVSVSGLLLLVLPFALGQTTTVGSGNGQIFNCPQQETIEVAYATYCPPSSRDTELSLTGKESYIYYDQAPTSYKTSEDAYALRCDYGDSTDGGISCFWFAGGGTSLHPQNENQNTNCPDISQNVPQPSPGVDYRRRRSALKRDLPAPTYTCPWTSNDDTQSATGYIRGSGYDVGQEAGITHGANQYYYCNIGEDQMCKYIIDDGVLTANGANIAACPSTLCEAQTTGVGNMRRGIYQDDMSVFKRQVNTKLLRERLARLKR